MVQKAHNVHKELLKKLAGACTHTHSIIANLREFEFVCLQQFVCLQLAKGAAQAAGEMTKQVEMAVLGSPEDTAEETGSAVDWRDHLAEEAQRLLGKHIVKCWKYDTIRALSPNYCSVVWLMGEKKTKDGFNGLLCIMRDCEGLSGLYSM